MGRTQYETIPHDEEDPLKGVSSMSSAAITSSGTRHRGNSLWIGGLFVFAVSAAIFLGFTGREDSRPQDLATLSQQDIPMEGIADVRPCTFDECNGSSCNHDYAPYTCLWHNGGPHGGW
jgi:hypothetical protein